MIRHLLKKIITETVTNGGVFKLRSPLQHISFNLFFASCSVVQATQGPEQKDLSVFTVGEHRDMVLAEMGQPIVTEVDEEGNRYDIFNFRQGQHGSVKAGKAFVYGILAVGTLGISEVVTSPLEGSMNGAEMKIKSIYGEVNHYTSIDVLQDDRWVPVQDIDVQEIE